MISNTLNFDSHRRCLVYEACVLLLSVSVTQVLSAEENTESPNRQTQEPELIPPVLVEHVEAEYPPEAFDQNLEAEVIARLNIDETGVVTDVEIVHPAGNGFDEAAAEAIKLFKFKPAMRAGEPTASILMYRYQFFIKKESPPPSEPKVPNLSASLSGRVMTMEDEPISQAFIALTLIEESNEAGSNAPATGHDKEKELEQTVESDSKGHFRFVNLGPGKYQVDAIVPGSKPFSILEELVEGEQREVVYRLDSGGTEFEVVIRGRRPPREVTRREITTKEINKIPGTSGDALRAVQNLPGMARASMMDGELIIRGSSHEDSMYFFDSLNTPLLYHFGGMTSVVNSDLLEMIDFYPGNFSARYGRATGGVVDVTVRAPKTDRFHGYVDADIWDVGALVETPLSKNWSLAVSARRSYIDAIMKGFDIFGDDLRLTVAPRYYDFQVVADYHPDETDNLRLFIFGSDDRMVMLWDNLSDNPNLEGGIDLHMYFYQAQARWNHRFSKTLNNQLNLGFGYWGGDDDEGTIDQNWGVLPLLIRDEITWNPGKYFILRLGTDTEFRWGFIKMKVPGDYGVEGEIYYNFSANDRLITFEGTRFHALPSAYGEFELTAIPRTRLIYGLRADYYSIVKRWGVDPRFAIRYRLFSTTTLKAGLGLFHQAPDIAQGDVDYGNPDLELTSAIHYSVGIEQEIFENLGLGIEGFYKDLKKVITLSNELIERDGEIVQERFNNDATGRVYGLEVELKHHPTDRFFGWITYTLMRSERIDEPGGKTRPFDHDQTHILTLVGSLNVGWGIDIGLRFRLVSGNPNTPVIGSNYDADSDLYFPIVGKINSDRSPMFHQLDLRIDKKWQWDLLALTVYADVRNVYNQKNVEGHTYSYDFSEKANFYGLPILPSLGIKAEY
ncbi:MAG: TonB-dependent receptor [Proteobacteria bacterium]|nr:TonB-dependent receptor [Pseudomonadota bacterium]